MEFYIDFEKKRQPHLQISRLTSSPSWVRTASPESKGRKSGDQALRWEMWKPSEEDSHKKYIILEPK